jgi:hypothetical protein
MAIKKFDVAVKTGSYTAQDGSNKGRYTNMGVMMQGDNGDFLLLDPAFSLAGALALQNVEAAKTGKAPSDRVMVSLFEPKQAGMAAPSQQQQPQQQQYAPQQPPQQQYAPQPQQHQAAPSPYTNQFANDNTPF